jgi:hypothetical protein
MSRTADTHPVEVAPEQLDRDTLQDTLMVRLRSWRRSSPQSLDKCCGGARSHSWLRCQKDAIHGCD